MPDNEQPLAMRFVAGPIPNAVYTFDFAKCTEEAFNLGYTSEEAKEWVYSQFQTIVQYCTDLPTDGILICAKDSISSLGEGGT